MIVAALLATPFLLDYDLVLLAVPLAWLAREGLRTGFLPWEKIGLMAGFVLPALSRSFATGLGLPFAPAVLSAVLFLIIRRAWSENATRAPSPAETSGIGTATPTVRARP